MNDHRPEGFRCPLTGQPLGGPGAWIPPYPLLFAQLAHGAAWAALAFFGPAMVGGPTPAALAWVHGVALGWLTLTALSVLVHVLPGVLDLEWVGERVARWALYPVALGVVGMVVGFAGWQPAWLAGGATVVVAGLAGYLVPAFLTLARWRHAEEPGPLAGAFGLVLGALAVAGTLGVAMAWAIAGAPWPSVLGRGPAVHALLAGVGWLTLLIVGVSPRPIFRVTGRPRRPLRFHRVTSTALVGAAASGVVGVLAPGVAWLPLLAAALGALGVLTYVLDLAPLLIRAPSPNRPAQAFIGASLAWFVVAAVLATGVATGQLAWPSALVYVALAGWMGQAVNGYLLHIGVRLLATLAAGEEDETEPAALLQPGLAWAAFGAFQVAVTFGCAGLLSGYGPALSLAGAVGMVGWLALAANIRKAWRQAKASRPAN